MQSTANAARKDKDLRMQGDLSHRHTSCCLLAPRLNRVTPRVHVAEHERDPLLGHTFDHTLG